MAQEIITLENLAAEIAKLRGELATWKALAIKQDRLNTAQMLAVNSGATAGKIAQIATNTSDIAALQQIASSAFRVVKVEQLPASGESYIMYLVPQTDGETLNYCNEYLWIDNAWELVGTTGAMANNGELQIIVNGVTVGTFTANQATNSTASITVPTDTSQLTNGAGYVDATALATALASKQDSLSLTQLAAVNSGITSADVAQIGANTTAIAGKQDALTTSQLAAVNSGITSADVTQIGTNTGNIATNSAAIVSLQGSKQNTLNATQLLAVNSGITSSLVTQIGTNQSDITTLNTALGQSLTPSADNTYSLGGASFRYANVYAVTFTGDLTGTSSRATADSDGNTISSTYGKLAGSQTWTGSNTFINNLLVSNNTNKYLLVQNTSDDWVLGSSTPSSTKELGGLGYRDKNDGTAFYCITFHDTSGNVYTRFNMRWKYTNGAKSTSGSNIQTTFDLGLDNTGTNYVSTNGAWKTNLTPYANSTYALGTSSYRWSSVYADSYYYGTTAWGLDKSNTWTGDNTYTKYQNIIITGTEIGVAPNAQNRNGLLFKDRNNEILGWVRSVYDSTGDLSVEMLVTNKYSNGALDPNGTQTYQGIKQTLTASGDVYFGWGGKVNNSVVPKSNTYSLGTSTYRWSSVYADSYYYGTTPFTDKFVTTDTEQTISKSLTPSVTATHSLGTSTNKWKTINGYEPSALGEVYVGNEVTIDTTGWALDGSAWNTLDTSIASGWVYFAVTDCDADSFILFRRGSNKAKNPTICFHPQHANSGTYYLYALFMVPKNTPCIVAIKTGTNGVLSQKLLYPCFGNV